MNDTETQDFDFGSDDVVDRLASEFLDAHARGEAPDRDEFLARVSDTRQRQRLEEILRFAPTAKSIPFTGLHRGSIVGPYRLEQQIGSGGMGTVWRVHDRLLECDLALKLLSFERLGSASHARRLEREAKLLAKLRHPNIVSVHATGRVGELSYVAMDLVDGVALTDVVAALGLRPGGGLRAADLVDAIGRQPSPGRGSLLEPDDDYWAAIARIMHDICMAVEAAHGSGVLHRDLKPGNIMITGGGHPVVLDFGLAGEQAADAGSLTEALVGTVPYMAPEQIDSGRVGNDPSTDIYQLGLVLYELLTLQLAYPQRSVTALLDRIRYGQFKPPRRLREDIPRDLESICLVACEPDPKRRFASAGAMAEDLERWLRREPIDSRPPLAHRRAALFARRHWRPLTAAALALVIGGVAGGLALAATPQLVREHEFYSVRTGALERRPATEPVEESDVLIVDLDLQEDCVMYALSVTGKSSSSFEYVDVLRPMTRGEIGRPGATGQLRTELSAGRQTCYLTKVSARPKGAPEWYEGVWVICERREAEWLHAWIRTLEHHVGDARRQGMPGVPIAAARALLRSGGRGGPIEITDEERRQLLAVKDRWPRDKEWPPGFRPLEGRFKLASAAK